MRAEELPTRLAGVALFVNLFTDLAEVKGVVEWDIWHPVADASLGMVEGRSSVTVRFSDGTPDVTFKCSGTGRRRHAAERLEVRLRGHK